MKINNGFILRQVNSADGVLNVVIAVGNKANKLNGYLTLNGSAVFLWNELKEEKSKEDLVNALLNEFDVSKEIAEKDVDAFISNLKNLGAIDDWTLFISGAR